MPSREELVAEELARVPELDAWPGLSARERERRAVVLADIRRRIARDGPHEAVPSPERGRLFQPFAALKGYDELTRETEGGLTRGDDRP